MQTKCIGNIFKRVVIPGSYSTYGFHLSHQDDGKCHRTKIENCFIYNHGCNAIYVNKCDDVEITGNQIIENGGRDEVANLRISNGARHIITDNVIRKAAGTTYGIQMNGRTSKCIIKDNDLRSSGDIGTISIDGDGHIITENILE
jgi:hypothetical protein